MLSKKHVIALVLLTCFILISSQINVYGDFIIDNWIIKTNMPTARYGLGVVALNDKVYCIGGYTGSEYTGINEEYDPVSDVWKTKASMPTARRFLGVAEANNKIYAIGGYTLNSRTNKVEEYDLATDKWSTKADMPTARHYLGVAQVNNKIYAIGGYENNAVDKVEEYDIATDSWLVKTNMLTARYAMGVIEANDKIYVIGGYTNNGVTNTVEEYDPVTDVWSLKSSMPTARYGMGIAVINDKIYAIGGKTNNGDLDIVEEYDPVTDNWVTLKSMTIKKHYFGASEANNKIYTFGGYSSEAGYINFVEEYMPPQQQNILLHLESSSNQIQIGTQFDVYVEIDNATNIYLEQIKIIYDSNLFELISADVVDTDKSEIYYSSEAMLGKVEYIVGNKGVENAVNGDSQILRLIFENKDILGIGDITITSGFAVNGNGLEILPICLGETFEIVDTSCDVNKDGITNLSDLAITAKRIDTLPDKWIPYEPDTNLDGNIEVIDLMNIIINILN